MLITGCRNDTALMSAIKGQVLNSVNSKPVSNCLVGVTCYDYKIKKYQYLGFSYTDSSGQFETKFPVASGEKSYFYFVSPPDNKYYNHPAHVENNLQKYPLSHEGEEFVPNTSGTNQKIVVMLRPKWVVGFRFVNEFPHYQIESLHYKTIIYNMHAYEPNFAQIKSLTHDTILYIQKYPDSKCNYAVFEYKENGDFVTKTIKDLAINPWDTSTYTIKY